MRAGSTGFKTCQLLLHYFVMRMGLISSIVEQTPPTYNTDNAFFHSKAFLYMQGAPSLGQCFFILPATQIIVIRIISYITQISFTQYRSSKVPGYKPPCPSYHSIGLVKGTQRTETTIHVYLFAYRPVSDDHPAHGSCGTEKGGYPRRCYCQYNREMLGFSSRHSCIASDMLYGVLPGLVRRRRLHPADYFIRLV